MRFGSKVVASLMTLTIFTGHGVFAQNDQKVGLRGGTDASDLAYQESVDSHGRSLTTAIKTPSDPDLEMVGKTKGSSTRRVIVRYKPGHKKQTMTTMMAANKQRATGEPEIEVAYDFEELNTIVINAMEDEIAYLINSPEIEGIEDDPIRYPMHVEGSNVDISEFFVEGSRKLAETIPPGITAVQAPQLWAQGIKGSGVKVCVIDTGIDQNHPDFVTSNLSGPSNTNSRNHWYEDGCGHGTHVSGTVSAETDDKGVVGVAPDAEIFTVRVFGKECGIIFGSSLVNAARTCRDNGAKIVSMSLGGPVRNFFEEIGFNSLVNRDDMLIIAAAGNAGDSSKSYPASYGTVMSVAAVNSTQGHAFFSQANNQVDIAAPGVDILSTFPVGGCEICRDNTDGYGAISGTSMATPHVSGVAALLMSAAPPSSTSADIRAALEASAQDLGSAGRDDYYGNGFVQASAALRELRGEDSGNTGGGDGGTTCSDVAGWHDSDGEQYTCSWYAQDNNCATYGSRFENDGLTANSACCDCGGGESGATDPVGVCADFPSDWSDSFGSFYDCDWYSQGNNCERFGDSSSSNGSTANDACCACGGGRIE